MLQLYFKSLFCLIWAFKCNKFANEACSQAGDMINCCCCVFSLAFSERNHFVETRTSPKCPLLWFVFLPPFVLFFCFVFYHSSTLIWRQRENTFLFCLFCCVFFFKAVLFSHSCCSCCWPWSGLLSCRCFVFSLLFIFLWICLSLCMVSIIYWTHCISL